ncbi:MAG: hypothetical protein K8U57_31275 [Planctomycetes bacterium]|nr:hypothetical protein [Planctomycetota bacterium]
MNTTAAIKCNELLPATKTSKHNGITWIPSEVAACGRFIIDMGRVRVNYHFNEFSTTWDGRAFRFVKLDEGTDKESDTYCVFIARSGRGHVCDCKGFAYSGVKGTCKHIAASLALIENRWV